MQIAHLGVTFKNGENGVLIGENCKNYAVKRVSVQPRNRAKTVGKKNAQI